MNNASKNQKISDALSANYLLLSLNISRWEARKKDRKMTKAAEAAMNTDGNVGAYWKRLLKGSSAALDSLNRKIDQTRLKLDESSTVWERGSRLVSIQASLQLIPTIRGMLDECETLLDAFLADYDNAVALAARTLGAAFDPADYPSKEWLRARYSFALTIKPVPTLAGLQNANIPADMVEQFAESMVSQLETAQRSTMERVAEYLDRLSGQLFKVAMGEPCRLHDTLVTDGHAVVRALRDAAADDAEILATADRIEQNLLLPENLDVGAVRHDPNVADKAQAAAAMAKTLRGETTPAPAPAEQPAAAPDVSDDLDSFDWF